MRKAKHGGKTVYLDDEGRIKIWWKKDINHIAIVVEGQFQSSVSPDPQDTYRHPHLFKKLAKCLRDAGAPHPPITEDE